MLRMNRLPARRTGVAAIAVVLVLAAAAIWGRGLLPRSEPIRILVAPELMDLRPVLEEFARAEGIRVELRPADGARIDRQIAAGRPGDAVDAVWLPADPEPGGAGERMLGAGRTIMSSLVLPALKESAVRRLGWTDGRVTWKQIAAAARGHRFTFGMSAPDGSFSGRSTVLAAATGLSGTIDSLSDGDIYPAAGGLRAISTAQTVTAATDAALIADFLRTRGDSADGLFTYESQIARLNASGRLRERLLPVHPSDGVISARYALRPMLKPRTPETAERLSRLTDRLLGADAQRRIAERTRTRPISPGVAPPADLRGSAPKLLDVPRDQSVVNRLVDVYLGRHRYATRTLFLLDVSNSMLGAGIADLRKAASALARAPLADLPASGIAADEQAVFLPFASTPGRPVVIDLSSARPAAGLRAVSGLLDGLEPGGNTAAYDALVAGLRELARLGTGDRTVSIVLITDGVSNRGRSLTDFLEHRAALPPGLREVPVYPVLVGGADESSMRRLAERTGGRLLDARDTDLATAFLTFRAQQ